jgi:hypothetical protein
MKIREGCKVREFVAVSGCFSSRLVCARRTVAVPNKTRARRGRYPQQSVAARWWWLLDQQLRRAGTIGKTTQDLFRSRERVLLL